jgi:hypothetical protein
MKKVTFLTAILLTINTFAQVPSYVPTTGLVGWWPFNGNANDESGNGNNGTVNGATLTSDRNGVANKAYSFDGVNDYIQAFNPLGNLTSDFTISSFANISTWQGGLFLHVGIDQNSFPRDGFGYGYGGAQAILSGQNYIGLLSNVSWYQSGFQFNNLSSWYNVVVTRSSNTLKYFVDGILVGNNTISSIEPPSNALFFGSGAELYANFNGKLDDIGIWNRALTQQEITALYNGCGGSSLISQPTNQSVNPTNTAQFSVSSTPGSLLQWQTDLGLGFQNISNVGQYSGANTDTLNISNVTMSNNNQQFRCIINSGSCSDTSSVAILSVVNNVGIEEQNQMQLRVYPNPTSSILTIENPQGFVSNFLIVDAQGRNVFAGNLELETTINLAPFSAGVYTILFENKLLNELMIIKE